MLAHFPIEVLAVLSEYVLFTDLIMLHACGDSTLNRKLVNAPVTFCLFSPRCISYYKTNTVERFGQAVKLDHVGRAGNDFVTYIPPTVRCVLSNCGVRCNIPESVEYLDVQYVDHYAMFNRKPGEIEVRIASIFTSMGVYSHLEYINHFRDYWNYNQEMANLKTMSLPEGKHLDPIPGVVFEYRKVPCAHIYTVQVDGDVENMWEAEKCTRCFQTVSVITREGTNCDNMPPCGKFIIENQEVNDVKRILASMGRDTREIEIRVSIAKMSEFCNDGVLDCMPQSVKFVRLSIIDLEGMPSRMSFCGVSKRYPFIIKLTSNTYWQFSIGDFTGIDDCDMHMVRDLNKRRQLMRTYPRLNFTGYLY